jgi:pimeloyl-ACP methyl ester carboxylesterase
MFANLFHALAAASMVAPAASGTPASDTKPVTVVLVHGAWADGSSWSKVIPKLLAKGIRVLAVQCPLTSLADDVAATQRVLVSAEGPVVLVGHSWGGMVVTEAGNDPKVKALVYVSAFSAEEGQSTGELVGKYPTPPALANIRDDGNGFLYISEAGFVENVAPDLPPEVARVLAVVQGPLAKSTFTDKITKAAWRTRPSWYVVSANDRCVSPELERAAAAMMGSTTIEVPSSHMSLMSHADEVAGVIIEAVSSVR